MFILLLASFCNAADIIWQNKCPFEMKLQIGKKTLTVAQGGSMNLVNSQQWGGRIYYGPSDWVDAHNNGSHPSAPMDAVGFLELASSPNGVGGDISEINFYGLPVRIDNARGSEPVGCVSTDYQGYEWQQNMIKNHCPTGAKKIDSATDVYYCPGIHGVSADYLVGKPQLTQYDVIKALETNTLKGQNYYKDAVDAQPGCDAYAGPPGVGYPNDTPEEAAEKMTHLMNCGFGSSPGCDWHKIPNDWNLCGTLYRGWAEASQPECFFWDYDPTDTTTKWGFSPYAAFMHKTCGPNVYATSQDDDGRHGGFFQTNHDVTVITCPPAGEVALKECAARSSGTTPAPGTTAPGQSTTAAPITSPSQTTSPGHTATTTAPSTTDDPSTDPSDDPSTDPTDPGEGSGIEVTVNVDIHIGNGSNGHVIA